MSRFGSACRKSVVESLERAGVFPDGSSRNGRCWRTARAPVVDLGGRELHGLTFHIRFHITGFTGCDTCADGTATALQDGELRSLKAKTQTAQGRDSATRRLRPPPAPRLAAGDLTYVQRSPVDRDLALAQWQGHVRAFADHGRVATEIAPADKHPDRV